VAQPKRLPIEPKQAARVPVEQPKSERPAPAPAQPKSRPATNVSTTAQARMIAEERHPDLPPAPTPPAPVLAPFAEQKAAAPALLVRGGLGRLTFLRRRFAGATRLRGFRLEEALGFGLKLSSLVAQDGDILAAHNALGLVGVARDRDFDRHFDFRMQRDRNL